MNLSRSNKIFKSGLGKKSVIGGKVEDGKAEPNVEARVKRGGKVTNTYNVQSIQKEKEEVSSMPQGSECGVGFAEKVDIQKDDVLELVRIEEKKRSL